MARIKRGTMRLKKRKALLKRTKGFRGGLRKLRRAAKTADTRAGAHAYRDRRVKKRNMRGLWQVRINAAARAAGMSYSALMGALKKKGVGLNRKVLSEIGAKHPEVFAQIADFARK